jgi:hypothetical protein
MPLISVFFFFAEVLGGSKIIGGTDGQSAERNTLAAKVSLDRTVRRQGRTDHLAKPTNSARVFLDIKVINHSVYHIGRFYNQSGTKASFIPRDDPIAERSWWPWWVDLRYGE